MAAAARALDNGEQNENLGPKISDLKAEFKYLNDDGSQSCIEVKWEFVNAPDENDARVLIEIIKNGTKEGEAHNEYNDNRFIHNQPQPSSSYRFKVTIENSEQSLTSEIVHTPANCVKNLEVTCSGHDKIEAKWDIPDGKFIDYEINVDEASKPKVVSKILDRNEYRGKGFTDNRVYTVRVEVRNQYGLHSKAQEANVQFTPAKVTSLAIKKSSSEKLKASWKQDQRTAKCEVRIYKKNIAVEKSVRDPEPFDINKHVRRKKYKWEKCAATQYTVEVCPKNSADSEGLVSSTDYKTKIPVPEDPQVSEEEGQIKVEWGAVCEGIIRYKVKIKKVKLFRNQYIRTYFVKENFVLVDLPQWEYGDKYEFQIRVQNSDGIKGEKIKVYHRIGK
ncbi:uncharacterized protein LOC120348354 [Styela clava]